MTAIKVGDLIRWGANRNYLFRVSGFDEKDIGMTDEGAPILRKIVLFTDDYGREEADYISNVEKVGT